MDLVKMRIVRFTMQALKNRNTKKFLGYWERIYNEYYFEVVVFILFLL